jgi:hypothetical protein
MRLQQFRTIELESENTQAVIDFVMEVKEPAITMAKLYIAQAFMTATYIYSLSCVGMFTSFMIC